jgi:hypothetical protein
MSYCKKISVFTLEHNPADKIFLVSSGKINNYQMFCYTTLQFTKTAKIQIKLLFISFIRISNKFIYLICIKSKLI